MSAIFFSKNDLWKITFPYFIIWRVRWYIVLFNSWLNWWDGAVTHMDGSLKKCQLLCNILYFRYYSTIKLIRKSVVFYRLYEFCKNIILKKSKMPTIDASISIIIIQEYVSTHNKMFVLYALFLGKSIYLYLLCSFFILFIW